MTVPIVGRPTRAVAVLACVCVIALSISIAETARAASISVACGDIAGLRSAISAANDPATHPGDDTISLAPACTYTIADEYSTGEALPAVTSTIILAGNGATIARADGDLRFRLFNVGASGNLIIHQLTLQNGIPAPGYTGGAVLVSGDLFVRDSTFLNNKGSAVLIDDFGAASFVDTDFTSNTHNGGEGGAIDNFGDLYVEGSAMVNNDTAPIPGFLATGGAIANSGVATVYRTSISGSNAHTGAAIRNSSNGDLLVVSSTISGNTGNIAGGAIDSSGTLTVQNSTLANNRGELYGGAVYLNGGTASFEHTTLAGNTSIDSGGIFNYQDQATVTIKNSILANNAGGNCHGAVTDGGYVIGYPASAACPATFLTGSPQLSSLGSFGGPTQTMRLGVGSAALDQIPASGAGCFAKDQRDFARPGGAACDIGAYENQQPSSPGSITGASPNQGSFTLTWGASTDADLDALSYVLESMDSDDASWLSVATVFFAQYGFSVSTPEREGRLHYRVRASDGRLLSVGYGTSGEIVVDRTAPAAPTPNADRAPDYEDPATAARWFADSVVVSFTAGTDPVLADGSQGSGIVSTTGPQTFTSTGTHVASGTSTDAAGNQSVSATFTLNVDADPPAVTFTACPDQVLLGATESIIWTASDAGSGLAVASSGSVALDTSAIGSHTAQSPAVSDHVGHSATALCVYSVVWDFNGFGSPLRAFPSVAMAGAGQQVRVSFSLGGDQGLGVFAAGYPVSAPIDCASSSALESGDPIIAGALSFSSATGDYQFQWRTSRAWAGTCRQLIVKLHDGTFHRANIRFR